MTLSSPVSGRAVHWESVASVLCWTSYLDAPSRVFHDTVNVPSARVTASPDGAGGGSSATLVTVIVTVAVSVPPFLSSAVTVRVYSSVVS